mmetsp:Transcript_9960/g.42079  ORF Transcript_9960/g.42079 Transcript_9960/m.42079 type:complete len:107 (-) Transcript_9960:1244-1564(-)
MTIGWQPIRALGLNPFAFFFWDCRGQQIYQNERLSKALLCFVVAEVLAILENCHACGIIHGALTSDTILLKGTSIHDAGTVVNHQIYEHGEVVHGQSLKSKRAVCV